MDRPLSLSIPFFNLLAGHDSHRPLCLLIFQRRLCGGKPGDRHPEGRAGHVVQADPVAELDAGRLAAMFAADAELDLRAGWHARARSPS